MNLPPADTAALLDQIERATTILLITHVSPDSDAVGSLLGLAHALRSRGKVVTPACSDALRDRFNILPGDTDVVTRATGPFDLAIALDCGDEARMGSVWSELPAPRPILLNLDHHVTNSRFGQINWVDPTATSTSEIVLELIDLLGVPLTERHRALPAVRPRRRYIGLPHAQYHAGAIAHRSAVDGSGRAVEPSAWTINLTAAPWP